VVSVAPDRRDGAGLGADGRSFRHRPILAQRVVRAAPPDEPVTGRRTNPTGMSRAGGCLYPAGIAPGSSPVAIGIPARLQSEYDPG